jgi:hypothetical protein
MKFAALVAIAVLSAPVSVAAPEAITHYGVDRAGAAKSSQGVVVLQLREDTFIGSPEGGATEGRGHASSRIDASPTIIANGVYSSPYQGFQILIPRVSDSPNVSVVQSVVSRRTDGTPITGHVLFTPEHGSGAAALVVTRLRDDRPKDSTYVLAQFAPTGAAEELAYEKQGVTFRRKEGLLGPVLERSIRNRVFTEYFPYRVAVAANGPSGNVGLARYVLMVEYLCEFSLIVDGSRAAGSDALLALAESEMDRFMGALVTKPH